MDESVEPLIEFDLSGWERLRGRLAEDLPRSLVLMKWIETRRRWSRKEPGRHPFRLLCPYGKVDDGVVALGVTAFRELYVTIYNFNDDVQNLRQSLLKTKLINWSNDLIVGVPRELTEWLCDLVRELECDINEIDYTKVLTLAKAKALDYKIDVPLGLSLAKLPPRDVAFVNSLWPHRFARSEAYLGEVNRLNRSLALHQTSTSEASNGDDKPVAWSIEYEYGDLGVLQTRAEHRRRGHASLLVRALAQQMAEDVTPEDRWIYACVVEGNEASARLLGGLGFEEVALHDWVHCLRRKWGNSGERSKEVKDLVVGGQC